ncbi:MAG: LysR family transcriptional regulator [Holophaga sp.]|nr:LysR family transcriptional regulator [Holophaga sp.]
MNSRQIRYFCKVVDDGNIVQAAKHLFVAPTAITMQVAQLEEELGGALFDRKTRPWELTTLGKFVFPRAKDILRQVTRLEEEAHELATGMHGLISIGFLQSTMCSLLPTAVKEFGASFPKVKIDLLQLQTDEQPEQLRSGRIQLGLSRFYSSFECPEDLAYTLLCKEPFLIVLPRNHPLAGNPLVNLPDLLATPFIHYPKDPCIRHSQDLLPMMMKAGFRPQIGQVAIEVHAAMGLVAAGLGFTLIPASLAVNTRSDVAFIPIADMPSETSLVAITMADQDSKLVQAFLEILRRQAR